MISINDLKPGIIIDYQNNPYEVLEAKHLHMGRGGAVVETKLRNLKTGTVLNRNFKPSDSFEELETEKKELTFLYQYRGEYFFQDENKKRISLKEELIDNNTQRFLKPNSTVEILTIWDEIIKIVLPIKIELKVKEAPPSIKGNTAQGGNKTVILETGAEISVPLFINEGDTILVNTQTGTYVERVQKK